MDLLTFLFIQREVSHQADRSQLGDRIGRERTFPASEVGVAVGFALFELLVEFRLPLRESFEIRLLFARRDFEERFGHAALAVTDNFVGHVVEERGEPVVVALRQWVVFVTNLIVVVVVIGILSKVVEYREFQRYVLPVVSYPPRMIRIRRIR